MWDPASAEELEAAVRGGELHETSQLDFKRALGANADIAVDVSAMTVDGGVIIYGIGEDENKRPTCLSPIELAGAPERIDQVLETSVHERPTVRFHPLPCPEGPARGYLVVVVPPSPRAPHQVVAKGKYQYRYYGRGATGNRILSEPEIARLYARREEWSFDRDLQLRTVIELAPFEPSPNLGYLHAFARPVVIHDDLWTKAARDDTSGLQRRLLAAAKHANDGLNYDPAIAGAHSWKRQGADAWRLGGASEDDPERDVRCEVNFDGRTQLFCGRVAARVPRPYESGSPGPLMLFEHALAGNVASYLALTGELYAAAATSAPLTSGSP